MSDNQSNLDPAPDLFHRDLMNQFWENAGPEMGDWPLPPDGIAHHYTSVDAAASIIESQTIWSSNIAFLNDANELICAQNVLKNLLNFSSQVKNEEATTRSIVEKLYDVSRRAPSHATFVTSFCSDGDLLGQWRGYGGGVSIGFDIDQLGKAFSDTSIVKIVYDPDVQARILDSLIMSVHNWLASRKNEEDYINLESEAESTLLVYFGNIAAKMKNYAFHEEREWRLVTQRPMTPLDQMPEVKFRGRNKALLPYVELRPREGTLPIKKITLSPNANDLAGLALQALLWKHGYLEVKVEKSRIPYRD